MLAYITLGGLSGAIYNEVLQFFVIIAGLVPLVVIGLRSVGGYGGLKDKIAHTKLGASAFDTWGGVGLGHWANLAADTLRTLQEVLAEVGADFPDVPVGEQVVEGPGGPALLSQATDATLLVVGARGRAAFPGMLLGSVAEYCVRHGHARWWSSAPPRDS